METKMNCLHCESADIKKSGKDRKGNQRFQCLTCKKTFIEPQKRLLGRMILDEEKAMSVLQHLVEGCSLRSTVRITGVHLTTILNLLELVGERCENLMQERIRGLRVRNVQCDEQWQYVGMKQKTKHRKEIKDEVQVGDSWVFTAIERYSKLILAWHLGRRTEADTIAFTEKLAYATEGDFQVTTDGFKPYQHAIVLSLGAQYVDFAQLVKIYAAVEPDTRYSPAECTGAKKIAIYGNPDMKMVSTSHVERHNLSTRMQSRRYTRLTNAFSKKWKFHHANLALWLAYYNFCRVHSSIRVTPAMEAGLTDHIWTLRELLG
jgi:transposase-like protein/IS1 family transposase